MGTFPKEDRIQYCGCKFSLGMSVVACQSEQQRQASGVYSFSRFIKTNGVLVYRYQAQGIRTEPLEHEPIGDPEQGFCLAFNKIRGIIIGALLQCALFACAQDGPPPIPKDAQFDVVSIRPSQLNARQFSIGIGLDDFHSLGVPLRSVLLRAYLPLTLAATSRLEHEPSWLGDEVFDFVGKVAPKDAGLWAQWRKYSGPSVNNLYLQSALRTALEERCKLHVHLLPSTVHGLAIVSKTAKSPPTLKPAIEGEAIPSEAQPMANGGSMIPFSKDGTNEIRYFHTSLAALAAQISYMYGVPIIDKSSVHGMYNFAIRRVSTVPDPVTALDLSPLGLKFVDAEVPSQIIVIDHIERPSPN